MIFVTLTGLITFIFIVKKKKKQYMEIKAIVYNELSAPQMNMKNENKI